MKHLISIYLLIVPALTGVADDTLATANWDSINAEFNRHYKQRNFKDALQYAKKGARVAKLQYGKLDSHYAESLNNLAGMHMFLKHHKKAESFFQQALSIRKQTVGKDHAQYAATLNNLGILYGKMGHYRQSIELLDKAIQIRRKTLGKGHPKYAETLHNQGVLYVKNNNYKKAEECYRQAKTIRKESLGKLHPKYALSLHSLATLYKKMGHFKRAEKLFTKAKTIKNQTLGENHESYLTTLNNMGLLYKKTGNYDKAELLYKQVKQNRSSEHPKYAGNLNNLGLLYKAMGRYEQAESLYQRARTIRKRTLGTSHPGYATLLHNLGNLYRDLSRYQEAEKLLTQAQNIYKQSFGIDHPKYAQTLDQLEGLYYLTNRYKQALSYHQKIRSNVLNRIDKRFAFLSAKGKKKFLETVEEYFNKFRSFTAQVHDSLPVTTEIAYNNELLLKSLILFSTRNMRQAVRQEGDSALMSTYNEWLGLRKYLGQQYSKPKAKRTSNIDSLENAATRMEQMLVKQSEGFRKERAKTKITWDQIRDTLRQDEVALELITYRPWDGDFSDTTRYAALLLTPDAKQPRFIPLCKEQELKPLLEKDEDTKEPLFINNLYSYQGRGSELYELFWSKLEPHLEEGQTIYYSPAGQIHQLALKAIPHPDDQALANRYNIVRLNSTRKLVTGAPKPEYTSATMFGGIKYAYNRDTAAYDEGEENLLAMRKLPTNDETRSIRGDFGFLDGSLKEVKTISERLSDQAKTSVQTGYGASEEAFKQLSGNSPQVLHIATHGFFFADNPDSALAEGTRSDEPTYRYVEDPLMRSGLAFAGSNYAWENGYNPYEEEDGILTAKEISNLDLSNTDLVVLSACETGLGEIKGSEGVYGLQRAFKMAGVDYLIMSLWKVPDEETRQLMQDFYDNWLNGQPIRHAFRNAQQKLAEDYPPYFWASFVLVGGGQEEVKQAGMGGLTSYWWVGVILVFFIGGGVALARQSRKAA